MILVFAGDNGAALPHGKGSLYDPGSNVPLIVRWPGIATKGGESRTLLSNEDIAPTLLESMGKPMGFSLRIPLACPALLSVSNYRS